MSHFDYCSIEKEAFCDLVNDSINGEVLDTDQDPWPSDSAIEKSA